MTIIPVEFTHIEMYYDTEKKQYFVEARLNDPEIFCGRWQRKNILMVEKKDG